jgi:hypothetical protein
MVLPTASRPVNQERSIVSEILPSWQPGVGTPSATAAARIRAGTGLPRVLRNTWLYRTDSAWGVRGDAGDRLVRGGVFGVGGGRVRGGSVGTRHPLRAGHQPAAPAAVGHLGQPASGGKPRCHLLAEQCEVLAGLNWGRRNGYRPLSWTAAEPAAKRTDQGGKEMSS